MPKPLLPPLVHDRVRLDALASLDLVDTPPEEQFDDIAHLAALVCNAPVALVSLVAGDRQWFKARLNFPACQTDLNASVCAYTLAQPDVLVIPDLSVDPRTCGNPLVTGEPFIRFYAGAPLLAPDGQPLGSLCVLDHKPRAQGLTAKQADGLRRLSRQVTTVLRERQLNREMRVTRDALRVSEERLTFAFEASGSLGWWDWDIAGDRLYAGERFARMYGLDPAEAAEGAPLANFVAGIHPDDRDKVGERIQHALDTAGEFSEEYRLRHADGTVSWVHARGRCFHDADGKPVRFPGIAVDVTSQHEAAAARVASEIRLKSVMETVPVGILLAEAPSGRILMGNQRLASFLGHDTLYAPSSGAYGQFIAFHADDSPVEGHEYPLAQITSGRCKQASLEVQYQRPDGKRRWLAIVGEAIEDENGATIGAVVAVSDIHERKLAEDNQDILNRELAHRLKNTLAIVQSIATQTLRGVTERHLVDAFERRVLALSRAHDVLVQKNWTAARMQSVIESVLVMQAGLDRFELDGPDFDINPQAALSLSLLLHELATNALKYGALSTEIGKVQITWRTENEQSPSLVLNWAERDGPPVVPPSDRGGFGSKLIRMGLLGTRKTDLDYEVLGLRAQFRAPLAEVQVLVH
ncbi:PAS domain-containing protein [Methylorubrum sp. DB1722]|uniref:PAS domain-containing protein n=1 Tax=Methylorubrum sp. DB1722 TaxID=2478916 RepID=UPI0018E3CACF|nr:PAS domain-containing protein [Methylorubrum sp. DB1722]